MSRIGSTSPPGVSMRIMTRLGVALRCLLEATDYVLGSRNAERAFEVDLDRQTIGTRRASAGQCRERSNKYRTNQGRDSPTAFSPRNAHAVNDNRAGRE
jgi:hypothetical protein